ncbi:hypothetical protein AB2B41_19675 [Marimonas sp. MJW-29]|uniref:Uncharacterized protein n=1 Tax=Sulfitobacter sediminis TaxID=3234186 RepID=A0ABV3RS55_9RHOB
MDEVLSAEADFGWVAEVQGLSEEQLEDVIGSFGCKDEETHAELRKLVPDAYRSFIQRAKFESSRHAPTLGENSIKPSTAVSRDLKRIGKAVEQLEQVLDTLDPATNDWFRLFQDERCIQAEDAISHDFELLRRQLDWPLGVLLAASREGESLSIRGPSNAATKDLIRRMANLWWRAHGALPIAGKGRGNRDQDPFLELCRIVHGVGRSELSEAGYHIGIGSLTRVVYDVLKQMKSRADS